MNVAVSSWQPETESGTPNGVIGIGRVRITFSQTEDVTEKMSLSNRERARFRADIEAPTATNTTVIGALNDRIAKRIDLSANSENPLGTARRAQATTFT